LALVVRFLNVANCERFGPLITSIAGAVAPVFDRLNEIVDISRCGIVFDGRPVGSEIDPCLSHSGRASKRRLDSVHATGAAHPGYCELGLHRVFLYMRSISSSYISVASGSPARIADVAQCLRWFRMSSRPTARSASCTDETCIMMSAQ